MNWTDRLLDLLEAKASLPQGTKRATAQRSQRNTKEANRAATRAYGTSLTSLRTSSGDSSPERQEAEKAARKDIRNVRGDTVKPEPEQAQVISGARPSKNQPRELSSLRGKKKAQRNIFQSDVQDAADARAVRAQSPDRGTKADPRKMAALKSALQAKFKP